MKDRVWITDLDVEGFILEYFIGGAKVEYLNNGILHEEYLTDEDYIVIEENYGTGY